MNKARPIVLTWDDVEDRLRDLFNDEYEDERTVRVWGVPRGGLIVALRAASLDHFGGTVHVVDDMSDADVILDDIVDSGATRARFPSCDFRAVVDKQAEGIASWVVFPWEQETDGLHGPEDAALRMLQFTGVTITDDLKRTPHRMVKALGEMTSGYSDDPKQILSRTFEAEHDQMVVLRGIRFASLCEHHLIPFTGTATVAYIPGERVVGISKLARLVECYARRLQIQERMTDQIASAIMDHLAPQGAGVVIRAHHGCMGCRGVDQADCEMVTSSMLGAMRDDPSARAEVMSLA